MTRPATQKIQRRSPFPALVKTAISAIALLAGAAIGPASAEKIANVSSGPWKGGVYTSDKTGSFSHCAANARYRSGVALFFSVTRKRQWSMAFANSQWSLRHGAKYPVRFQVDNGPIMKGTAVAKTNKMVQVHLPPKDMMFQHFKAGGTLKVAAGKRVMRFSLTGTGPMLSQLYKCAVHFARKETQNRLFARGRNEFKEATTANDDAVPADTFF